MSSIQPGAATFQTTATTLQYPIALDSTSNPVVGGDVVTLLTNGNARRADNGTVIPVVFDTAASNTNNTKQFMAAANLSATTFVIVYLEFPSTFLYAIIGTVSGNTITYGTPTALTAAATTGVSCCSLSSTSFAVSYLNSSTFPSAVVCTVAGSVITVGTPVTVNAVASTAASTGTGFLSSTAFVCAYTATSNFVNAVVCSVSGTTITVNTPVVLNGVSSTSVSSAGLSSTSFIVGYTGSSNFINAVVATISGTTISGGTPQVLNGTSSQGTSIAALDATDFVIAYTAAGSTTCIVGSISGTVITAGSAVAMGAGTGSISPSGLAAVSSTAFIVAARSSGAVICTACTQSGNVITKGTTTTVTNDPNNGSSNLATQGAPIVVMDSGHAVVAYCTFDGRSIVVPFSGTTITYAGTKVLNAIGIAAGAATPGNSFNVVQLGYTNVNIATVLTLDTQYYWDAVIGTLSTTSSYPYAMGISLTSQALLVARNTGSNNQYFG